VIDPNIFDVRELVAVLLNIDNVPGNWWRRDCEIVKQDSSEGEILVVRHIPTNSYLRHSKGPVQSHKWNIYGSDYMKPEWALLALSMAPAPCMCKP
jgi:hypothetical protein